jgi:dihydroorotate dehydrogenase (fumarate)
MDLTTRYLGFALKNPLIASSSPLTRDLDNIRRLEDCGAAAIVLPSIFEEQIEAEAMEIERLTAVPGESFAEALSYFPAAIGERREPHRYLETIRRAREAVAIPIIASLNGISPSGWRHYVGLVEQAGASAIELNAYFIPSDLRLSGAQVEAAYLDVLKAVKAAASVPVAVKLSPYFSALGHVVRALDAAGADGFTLFNRFYQPDIDLVRLRLKPDISLSRPSEIRLPLLWIGVLAGNIRAALAASTGVDSADEVIKFLLVGADAVMTTSSLLRHGIGHMTTLIAGLERWLEARNIDSVGHIRGKMKRAAMPDPTAFDRANYIESLSILAPDHDRDFDPSRSLERGRDMRGPAGGM